jgi:hypothetical protein
MKFSPTCTALRRYSQEMGACQKTPRGCDSLIRMNRANSTKALFAVMAITLVTVACSKETSTAADPQASGTGTKAGGAPASDASQFADMSKYVTADGITIPRDNQGAPKGPGVYFEANEGDELTVSLTGHPTLAMLKYSGTMECTREGRLGGGTKSFKPTQLETSKSPDKWLPVTAFSFGKDGFLVVTDRSGSSYRIKLPLLIAQGSGTIEEL